MSTDPLRRLLAGGTRAERGPLARYLILSSTSAVAAAAVPWLIGSILDSLQQAAGARLTWLLVALAAAIGVGILVNVSRHVLAERLKVRVAAQLRTRIGLKVAHAAGEVADRMSPSQVTTIASSDVEKVAGYPAARIRLVSSIVGMLVVTSYLVTISRPVALLVLVGVPAFMWLTARIAKPLEARQDQHRDRLGTMAALSADIGLGLRILRGLAAEGIARSRLAAASEATEAAGIRVARIQALVLMSGQLLPGLFLTALIWFGGYLAVTGSLPATALVTFYAASAYLVIPITAATDFGGIRSGARVGARRIVGLLDVPERPWSGTVTAVPHSANLIDEKSGLVVRAGGLTVVSGSDIEAVGRRLAGMTDDLGPALRGYARAELRAAVRYQGARSTMFSGTVRDLLDPTGRYDDKEIAAVLQATAGDDVVSRLDGGLDARIHADGRSVSGGQRQRLALARALLGNPPYLVLVEPTSALDAVTEVEVTRRVADQRRGLTTVVLTHGGGFRAVADHLVTLETSDV
jgi:ABC-type multidrug transport system fused ATPase/permease subunit